MHVVGRTRGPDRAGEHCERRIFFGSYRGLRTADCGPPVPRVFGEALVRVFREAPVRLGRRWPAALSVTGGESHAAYGQGLETSRADGPREGPPDSDSGLTERS
ncbi:hypothetical protein DBP12_11595 [Streptomyces sp. CS014]|nr:hypothetical protein DBP12_11595 [Streptomyces sp. CS014]